MANKKISDLTAAVSLTAADLLEVSKTIAAVQHSRKGTIQQLFDLIATVVNFQFESIHIGVGGTSHFAVDNLGTCNMDSQLNLTGNAGEIKLFGPGLGVVLTTPDGLHTYRISIDNNGNLGTTQVS